MLSPVVDESGCAEAPMSRSTALLFARGGLRNKVLGENNAHEENSREAEPRRWSEDHQANFRRFPHINERYR